MTKMHILKQCQMQKVNELKVDEEDTPSELQKSEKSNNDQDQKPLSTIDEQLWQADLKDNNQGHDCSFTIDQQDVSCDNDADEVAEEHSKTNNEQETSSHHHAENDKGSEEADDNFAANHNGEEAFDDDLTIPNNDDDELPGISLRK